MRYSQIVPFEVCNGEGIGVSLFVQGCHFHCKGCFNSEAWDFNSGKEWTKEIEEQFFELINKPYIKRISILGGEPLANENVNTISNIVWDIKEKFGESKAIWLYTGYTWDEATLEFGELVTNHNGKKFERHVAVEVCDIVVDGRFEEDKKDLTLKFRGSTNQRVIDVHESLKQNKIILHCD